MLGHGFDLDRQMRIRLLLGRCYFVAFGADEDKLSEFLDASRTVLTDRSTGRDHEAYERHRTPFLSFFRNFCSKHGLPRKRIDEYDSAELQQIGEALCTSLEAIYAQEHPAKSGRLPHLPSGARFGWVEAYEATTGRKWDPKPKDEAA